MKVLRDLEIDINEDIFISGLSSSSKLVEKDQWFYSSSRFKISRN